MTMTIINMLMLLENLFAELLVHKLLLQLHHWSHVVDLKI